MTVSALPRGTGRWAGVVLVLAVLVVQDLVIAACSSGSTWRRFSDPALGIEFSYPSDRTVATGCHGSKTCVALIGTPMPGSDYLVAFEVFEGGLDAVAEEKAVFSKTSDGWVARGRFDKHPVTPLKGPGWHGIKSIVGCGVSGPQGFHAAGGKCLWAVLSSGTRSVVVDTQGIVGLDESSLRSIESLRFSK